MIQSISGQDVGDWRQMGLHAHIKNSREPKKGKITDMKTSLRRSHIEGKAKFKRLTTPASRQKKGGMRWPLFLEAAKKFRAQRCLTDEFWKWKRVNINGDVNPPEKRERQETSKKEGRFRRAHKRGEGDSGEKKGSNTPLRWPPRCHILYVLFRKRRGTKRGREEMNSGGVQACQKEKTKKV